MNIRFLGGYRILVLPAVLSVMFCACCAAVNIAARSTVEPGDPVDWDRAQAVFVGEISNRYSHSLWYIDGNGDVYTYFYGQMDRINPGKMLIWTIRPPLKVGHVDAAALARERDFIPMAAIGHYTRAPITEIWEIDRTYSVTALVHNPLGLRPAYRLLLRQSLTTVGRRSGHATADILSWIDSQKAIPMCDSPWCFEAK